jgi:hypothetical protein
MSLARRRGAPFSRECRNIYCLDLKKPDAHFEL